MISSSSSSAFSFRCTICVEEFDPTNYPVVLPCGHTYVCINCANRIDKCMECRAPLSLDIKIEKAAPSSPTLSTTVNNCCSPRPQRQRPLPWYMRQYMRETAAAAAAAAQQQQQQQQRRRQQQSSIIKKYRLPLPKNVVLLSLIQASEPGQPR